MRVQGAKPPAEARDSPALPLFPKRFSDNALGKGILCSLIMGAVAFADYSLTRETSPSYTVDSLLYQLLRSINTWTWLIVRIGGGLTDYFSSHGEGRRWSV